MMTYFYETRSNAAPFVSDSYHGFVEAEDPMEALKKVVAGYKHSAGLFAAEIMMADPSQRVLARYRSARAHTQVKASGGTRQWKEDGLYVDGKLVPMLGELWQ